MQPPEQPGHPQDPTPSEEPSLPALLPVAAIGGLIVVLVLTAFLAGVRAPERAREQLATAQALLEEGKTEEAVRLLGRAARQDPELLPARCLLGELLLGQRRRPEAATHLEACLEGMGQEADPAERERIEELLRRAQGGRKGGAPGGGSQP
jgi:thioredoxin-like negative regulator of GroEL